MKRLGEWLRSFFPRRRLRSWRYVSPRRHGAGALLLLALVSALSAYWYLTNDRQIRHQVHTYLTKLTGCNWRVDEAHFSLFGGIELRGVELRVPGQEQPFFRPERLRLRHDPWALLVHQRLEVREITCEGALACLTYDVASGSFLYPKLHFSMGGEAEGPRGGAWWPPLSAHQVSVQVVYRDANFSVEHRGQWRNIAGFTRPGTDRYEITLTGDANGTARVQGSFSVNMLSGEIASAAGIEVQDSNLIQQFQALKDLGIHGRILVTGRWDPQTGGGFLDANLADASMDLPADLGGLALRGIRGLLHLDANGILVRDLQCQVPQAGGAKLSVSGRYEGFEANSPFDFRVAVKDLELPGKLDGNGAGARLMAYVHEHYKCEGKLDGVSARLVRGPDGHLTVDGNAAASSLVTMDKSFPYELRGTQVDVHFTDQWLEFRKLAGTHGSGRIEVTGKVRYPPEGKTYELLVRAIDVPADAELKSALNDEQRQMWDAVNPVGKVGASIRVHVDSPGQTEKQDVTLLLNGGASVEYVDFPYRLDKVYGEVQLGAHDISLNSLSGSSPQMNCTVAGAIHLDEHFQGEANLTVTARLPLDGRLEAALGRQGKAAFGALRPAGMAQNVLAKVWRRPGEEPWFHVTAELDGGSFTFDRFPYCVTETSGLLVLEPNQAFIQGVRGRHGDTPVALNGTVSYGQDRVGLDLQMEANSMRADQDLFGAVPSSVQRVWKQLSPSGLADVVLSLHWNMPDDANAPTEPNDMRYVCSIQARDMGLKYSAFPYAIRGLSGRAVVTPGRVELRDVAASFSKPQAAPGEKPASRPSEVKLALSGAVTSDGNGDRADLSLRAEGVPLDSELLSALPLQAVPIFGRLKPGGSCSLNFSRMVLVSPIAEASPAAPATGPAAASGPQAATRPLAPLEGPFTDWLLEGEMSLKDADVDLGIPARLTGGLGGRLTKTREGLRIDANLLLGSLGISQRVISDVSAKMRKEPSSSLIRIDDILGKAYGGRLAGFAEVRLGDAPEYGLRVFAEGMDLNDLFNGAVSEPNQRIAVEGKLDATIELKYTGGPKPLRQVSGLLHLAKAKTQKLPVLVDQLQPVFLSLPDGLFSEGVAEYTLKEDKVLFREIHLVGPGVSILGSGTLNLKNESLKLTFISRPGLVPSMDSVGDELVGGILRELMEVQVTGSLKKPRFRSVPLRGVDAIVRKLLNPEAE